MRLKSHESPRQQGRNHRGRGGAARKRQLDKRNRTLMQRLRQGDRSPSTSSSRQGQFNPAFFVAAIPCKFQVRSSEAGSQPTVSAT